MSKNIGNRSSPFAPRPPPLLLLHSKDDTQMTPPIHVNKLVQAKHTEMSNEDNQKCYDSELLAARGMLMIMSVVSDCAERRID